ncbi:MAG TPA: L,D-transpeptidase family protein, partial [Gemmatimonadales bacterium]|nr:L,D-transpeptidase family protein [Gemmatimonadales bacterium]
KVRVRQKPGRNNQLGLVKFMFPNQFAIYLHDTPTRNLFHRRKRTLSHGCVWVRKPVELADYVLEGQEGWDGTKVRQAMLTTRSVDQARSGDARSVPLVRPVPVYLVYLTAFVRDGVLNFRPDAYGKDREAMARVGKLSPTDPRLCEELQKLLGG